MQDKHYVYLAWFVCGIGIALSLAASIFSLLTRSIDPESGPWYEAVINVIPIILSLIAGGLIASRLTRNLYGLVWILFGLGMSIQGFAQGLAGYILAKGFHSLSGFIAGQLLASIGWQTTIGCIALALLLFPTGHPISSRWIFVVWLVITGMVVGLGIAWAAPGQSAFLPIENPLGNRGFFGKLALLAVNISFFCYSVAIIFGVVSLIIRFTRSMGVERQQIKWFALAGVGLLAYLIASFWLTGFWNNIFYLLALSFLPVAIGIAILRHRLWEIDVIIHRTLVYSILTAVLSLVYFGSVVLLQELFQLITGQEQSPVATVLSTLAIAALFTPLRRAVQDRVDRRFYRQRYDAEHTLQAFAGALRGEVNLEEISDHLLSVVQETMQPTHVSLWLNKGNRQPRGQR